MLQSKSEIIRGRKEKKMMKTMAKTIKKTISKQNDPIGSGPLSHEKDPRTADSLRCCHATAERPLIQSKLEPLSSEDDPDSDEEEEEGCLLLRLDDKDKGRPKAAISSGSTKPSKAKSGQPCSSSSPTISSLCFCDLLDVLESPVGNTGA
jgi:hypothetical protein